MSRIQADLGITAAIAVLASAAAAANAPVAIMTVLGILLFAAPGYLLGRLLLGHVAGLERVVVATGLAFCVPILGGLLLYVAGFSLHQATWLGLLGGVTLTCDLVLFLRRLLRGPGSATAPLSMQRERRRPSLPLRHAVAFGAALAIAVCAVGLASVGAAKQHYSGFTQLWLVHQDQDAPTAKLGVTNYEGRTVRYKLVLFDNSRVAASWTLDLSNGQTWQQATKFTGRYTVTAKLYRLPDISSAYRYVVISGDRD